MDKDKKPKNRLSLNKKSERGKQQCTEATSHSILSLFQRQAERNEETRNQHDVIICEAAIKRRSLEPTEAPVEKRSKYFTESLSEASSFAAEKHKKSLSPTKKLSLKRQKLSSVNKESKEITVPRSQENQINNDADPTSSLITSTNTEEKGVKTADNDQILPSSCDNNSDSKSTPNETEEKLVSEQKEVKSASSLICDSTAFSFPKDSESVVLNDDKCTLANVSSNDPEETGLSSDQTAPVLLKTDSVTSQSIDFGDSLTINKDENLTIDPVTGEIHYKVPYYLENFLFILNYVINEDFYAYLFNERDVKIIRLFLSLEENCQKLYVRLFGRCFRWIRKNKIVYPKISDDLTPYLCELCENKLLLDESMLDDLAEVLKGLPSPELKTVAKSLRLNVNQVRSDLIEAIMKHTEKTQNIGAFFKKKETTVHSSARSHLYNSVLQRSKKLLGSCYKLDRECRSVFMRVTMLFGLHNMQGEDDDKGGAAQMPLFQILLSNIGRLKYPEYKVYRKTRIFQDRDALQRFSSALQLESDISDSLEKKDFESALEIYNRAKDKYSELIANESIVNHDSSLPDFLRKYTAGSVLTRVLSYGVELFQFTKKYECAVEQLNALIQQQMYHLDYRGRWFERLALNLDHHLKRPAESLDLIRRGLEDDNIRKGHRLALYQRAQKICNASSNKKLRRRWAEFSQDVMACVHDPPKVIIEGKRLDNMTTVYISDVTSHDEDSTSSDVTLLKRVEDVALNHYKQQGYTEGLHAEGGIFSFLLMIYMWDILYCDNIPDVFYNLYQALPLDLYTKHFYTNRKQMIDSRLNEIKGMSEQTLQEQLAVSYEQHKDTVCMGGQWELFRDVAHAQGLVACMGGSIIAAIFDRIVKDLRFTRSGVPDLTVWNPQTKKFKISEVKGPGDRLSTKQILWIDYLLCLGLDAEVCHVQAVGAKRIH